jgi:hypothetical protein
MMRVFCLIFTSWCKKLINKRGCHFSVYEEQNLGCISILLQSLIFNAGKIITKKLTRRNLIYQY